jgi:hypothetical protein
VHYELGPGHPLLGRRMPDLELTIAGQRQRAYTLLHEARAVLLCFNETCAREVGAWAGRVRRVEAQYTGAWDLPVLGVVPAPDAVLIRPDGYVAWVSEGSDRGLHDALTAWFGAAEPAASR